MDSRTGAPGDQVVEVIVITEILYHSPIELVFEAPVRHCQFELAFELIESTSSAWIICKSHNANSCGVWRTCEIKGLQSSNQSQ